MWLDSSVDRALHRYRKVMGSSSSLEFFFRMRKLLRGKNEATQHFHVFAIHHDLFLQFSRIYIRIVFYLWYVFFCISFPLYRKYK